jgi:branched-chain amino acid transport system substrate-binding protein
MLTISGATAFLGEDSRGGIEIAIVDRGQLLGHDIQLTGEDSL